MSENIDTEDTGDNFDVSGSGIDPKMLARVRKLFSTAESLAGTPAAESYEDKAIKLLTEHGISERVARMRDTSQVRTMTKRVIRVTGMYLPQRRALLSDIGRVYGVYVTWNYDDEEREAYNQAMKAYNFAIWTHRWNDGPEPGPRPVRPQRNAMKLSGYDTDIERTELLYTLLVAQSYAALKKVTRADIPWYFSGNLRSWRTSYFEGWVARVGSRVEAMEREEISRVETMEREDVVKAETSTALVLVSPIVEAQQFAEADGSKAKATSRQVRSGEAYRQGWVEGENVNIGQTGVTDTSAAPAIAG